MDQHGGNHQHLVDSHQVQLAQARVGVVGPPMVEVVALLAGQAAAHDAALHRACPRRGRRW